MLRGRAERALGDLSVTDAVAKTRARAITGPHGIPDGDVLAQAAYEKLRAGQNPTTAELKALETVVRLMRPVVFVRQNALDDLPDTDDLKLRPAALREQWDKFRGLIAPMLGSIGRVDTEDNRHVGTGFLVAPDLLATNYHVLSQVTFGTHELEPNTAKVVFRHEVDANNRTEDTVHFQSVAKRYPALDMVLLRLARPQDRPVLQVSDAPAQQAMPVAAIGFPGNDEINNPQFLAAVFNGKFGYKRAALGEVLDDVQPSVLFHDCSTTRGNSGSPLLSLASASVVGMHRSGYFMYRNEAVPAAELQAFIGDNS